jgi:putative membrane protein
MWLSNPTVEIGALAWILVYVWVARRIGKRLLRYQWLALTAAMTILVLTLDGPLDALADARFFTAHMMQHLVLALVIPPLLLLGIPNRVVEPLLSIKILFRLLRVLTQPLVAYMVYNLTLIGMHSPRVST